MHLGLGPCDLDSALFSALILGQTYSALISQHSLGHISRPASFMTMCRQLPRPTVQHHDDKMGNQARPGRTTPDACIVPHTIRVGPVYASR